MSNEVLAGLDRELFSELEEPPIQPALLHMEPQVIHGLDPNFQLHVSCQLLFSWKKIRQKSHVFSTLAKHLRALGYVLCQSSAPRIGKLVLTHMLALLNDLKLMKTACARKKRMEKWIKIFVHEHEVESLPAETIKNLAEKVASLKKENQDLIAKLDEQAGDLYEAMKELTDYKDNADGNVGKPFHKVGEKQQKRQLAKIRYVLKFLS